MSAINKQTKVINGVDMPDKMIDFALDLFSVPATSTNETGISIYVSKYLDNQGIDYKVDISGNIVISKGEAGNYPCFVSHLDTVHSYGNGFNIALDVDNNIIALDNAGNRVGCGGDDRNGIFTCLYLLSVVDNIKVVLFSREETGGIGSGEIGLDFFDDCSFIASIDRWGNSDFICEYNGYTTCSEEFINDSKDAFNKFGYKKASGYFTDSFNLMGRGIGISCMNLSCGYYQHHSDQEYTSLRELWAVCLLSIELCNIGDDSYAHKPGNGLSLGDSTELDWDIEDIEDSTDKEYMIEVLADYEIYTDNPTCAITSLPEDDRNRVLMDFYTDRGYPYISDY